MTDTKKANKPCYFAQLFRKGNFLYSLLFFALTFSVVLLNYKYSAYAKLSANKPLFGFVIAVACIFFILTLVYMLANLKKHKTTVADSIALSFGFMAIFFFIYFGVRSFSTKNILFSVILLVVGGFYLTIRALNFNKLEEKSEAPSAGVSGYYKAIFNKYSLLSVIVTAFVMACLAFLVMDYPFRKVVTELIAKTPAILFVLTVTALIIATYVAVSVSSRKVGVFDVLLLASGIVLITVLIQILTLNNGSVKQLTLWAALVAAYLVITFIRYISVKPEQCHKCCCKENKGYLAKIFCKYDGLLILSIASAIVSLFIISYEADMIHLYLPVVKGRIIPAVNFIPFAVVVGTALLTMIVSVVLAFTTLAFKKVSAGDFFLVLLEAISLFSLLLVFVDSYIYFIAGILILNVLSLTLIVARIRSYKENK